MGKGRHNTRADGNDNQPINATPESVLPANLPTLSEIKVKIPPHCFRPTVRQSMGYVIKDVVYVALTFLAMYTIRNTFEYGFLLFPLYWYMQGTLYTSFFVLGHDCGHGSFSFYPLLNDIVGESRNRSTSSSREFLFRNYHAHLDLGSLLSLEGKMPDLVSVLVIDCLTDKS